MNNNYIYNNIINRPIIWILFIIVIFTILILDIKLTKKNNKKKGIKIKKVIISYTIWLLLTGIFIILLWFFYKQSINIKYANKQIKDFLYSYFIESMLSIDNMFIFFTIFQYFNYTKRIQKKILSYGLFISIILRSTMIYLGSFIINKFHWITYFIGILLIIMSINMLQKHNIPKKDSILFKILYKCLPIDNKYNGKDFFVFNKKKNKYYISILLVTLIIIEITDIFLAIDSITAIFSVVKDPFIILTSNIFAIICLRTSYFLIQIIYNKFKGIKYILSSILMFLGIKIFF